MSDIASMCIGHKAGENNVRENWFVPRGHEAGVSGVHIGYGVYNQTGSNNVCFGIDLKKIERMKRLKAIKVRGVK